METVRDVMSTDVESCTPLDNVYEVAVKMKELNVGAIPIIDDGNEQLIGMITDRDLVVRGIAEKRAGSNQVTNVMSEELITCSPEMSLEEASTLMAKHQIRRLPVVENGQLIGIVSLGDLATYKMSNESAGEALSEISEKNFTQH
ncbi:CBS domain-containing protein [Fredinandcohnia quinoae]|uniref:CBS domain-containing protein n=1 Tax=Fredinandcohnia quinoae TaxID=2918902 RepID=A0AAW5DTC7_9BACI|nr:CBS domain-containing protein [Fredinandcohnia sp. SECRCQ15]MCH1623910.1 CBS domain-containing protein [Fredinandcohnia sp. SECRCQ15]